ncbi:MAG: glutamate--tRNA ligase [Dysgonamonadaceae bacterium]|jgi:glutamyl-tRNA synthetase|nr:glutamate--tRNA ligase [Dysgonamonadaceae bacterium]
MKEIRTRFAPSPTGFMHIGNLRTALYAYLFAKKNGGKFVLRIEDTDRERLVENAVETIYNTLKLAGLQHDEGPDAGGLFGPYVQSERREIYYKYAQQLIESGNAYYCFCSKERLETLTDESGNRRYDKHCLHLSREEINRNLAAGIPYVIRQNVPIEGSSTFNDLVFGEITVDNRELHDNVLIKSDGYPTYNFANIVDDHLMQISHVLRGMEYLSSTPNYNLLYNAFGWDIPEYIHLPHIMRDKQHKLSKRYGDANFEDFLEKGFLPEAIINYVALLGWNPKNDREKFTLSELVDAFDIAGISKSAAVFDEIKLRWLNSQYIQEMSLEEFEKRADAYYENLPSEVDRSLLSRLLQPRIAVFSDILEKLTFITGFDGYDIALLEDKNSKTTLGMAITVLPEVIKLSENVLVWENEALFEAYNSLTETLGIKRKQLLWIVRISLTGQASTPCGATEACVLLGRKESVRRLQYSLQKCLENYVK